MIRKVKSIEEILKLFSGGEVTSNGDIEIPDVGHMFRSDMIKHCGQDISVLMVGGCEDGGLFVMPDPAGDRYFLEEWLEPEPLTIDEISKRLGYKVVVKFNK